MSIKVEGLTFAYGDNIVLQEINMKVETCERIGIIGTSGCGKSTLLKLLSGLYTAKTGKLEVAGARESWDIRRNVSAVMQNAMLFPVSIRENITCGHEMSEDVIRRACEAARLTDWIAELPNGMDTFVGERGGKISGGQAQRIAIARAIAKQAPVVLLDEATSALDTATAGLVLSALSSLTQGKTTISVSHRPESFINYDRVFKLEGGRLNEA